VTPILPTAVITACALACALATGALPATAHAATPAAMPASKSASGLRFHAWRGDGFRVDVPAAEHTVQGESFPDALPRQAVYAADILRGKDMVARIESFSNRQKLTARQWLAGDQAFLVMPGSVVTDVPMKGKRTSVRLVQPRTPQTPARDIVLISDGSALLRLTCERSDDPDARAVLDRAAATIRPVASARTVTARRKP
jgi:hypothetical protein